MIEIRRAQVEDAASLAQLGRSTFIETFGKDNTPEDMSQYVHGAYNVERQTEEITDPKNIIEIAILDGKPVGFLFLKNGDVDPSVRGDKPVELLRLYVSASLHGKGVGAALMEKAISLAKENAFKTLWLGVWERNLKAQKFYIKYGFKKTGSHIFRLGSDEQTDFIFSVSL